MKKTYLYSMLCLYLFLFETGKAQEVFTSELATPRAGDELIRRELAFFSAGDSGATCTWDFSRINLTEKEQQSIYFDRSGKLTGIEGERLNAYLLSGDSLLLTGQESASSIIKYHTPQLLLKFPLAYGSHTQSPVYGKGRYYDKMEIRATGTVQSRVDGAGRLILPGGSDTLDNVLRVHLTKSIDRLYTPLPPQFDIEQPGGNRIETNLDSSRIEIDYYLWFAPGYRYPVLETNRRSIYRKDQPATIEQVALLCSPSEQNYLSGDDKNTALRSMQQSPTVATGIVQAVQAQPYRIYPNPVRDRLHIDFSLEERTDVGISLYDMQGKLIYQNSCGSRTGNFSQPVEMNNLPRGNYMLRMQIGDKSVNEKIVKQ